MRNPTLDRIILLEEIGKAEGMMTLQDAIRVIDELSPDELHQLRTYIEQREDQLSFGHELSPEEHGRLLDEAFAELRAGLTQQQLDEMTEAMNADFIQPWDESEWRD
jgi:phage shock protein A